MNDNNEKRTGIGFIVFGSVLIIFQLMAIGGNIKQGNVLWEKPGFLQGAAWWFDLLALLGYSFTGIAGLALLIIGFVELYKSKHTNKQNDSGHVVDRTVIPKRIKNGLLLLLAALATIFALYSCSKSNEASPSSTTGASHNQSIGTTQTTSGITVYITETGEKYHRSWCQYLSSSKIPISLEEAVQRGYGRCSKCDPPRLTTTEKTRYTIAQNDGFVFSPTNSIPYLTMPTQPTVNVPTLPQPTAALPLTTPQSETISTPTTVVAHQGYITLGSTQEDVKEVMGTPDEIHDYTFFSVWYYGSSTVTFDENGKVNEWSNQGNLSVWIGDIKSGAAPVTIGSSQSQVIDAMGTPEEIHNYTSFTVWYYGTSTITFDKDGKAKEWSNQGNLHVWIGDAKDNAAPISVGSSQSQVADAMGTPREIHDYTSFTVWYYGRSTITFDESGKVKEWSNYGELKLE